MHRRGRSSIPRYDKDDSERWFLDEEINLISWNASVAGCDKTSTIIESIEAETNRPTSRFSHLLASFSSILTLLTMQIIVTRCIKDRTFSILRLIQSFILINDTFKLFQWRSLRLIGNYVCQRLKTHPQSGENFVRLRQKV